MEIIFSSIHNVDVKKNLCEFKDTKDFSDANKYIEKLIKEVFDNKNKRKYKIKSNYNLVTGFAYKLFKTFQNKEIKDGEILNEECFNHNNEVARRFLDKESAAQDHLDKTLGSKIREGSLIQIFFEDMDELYLLISKIESRFFLDTVNGKYGQGLPDEDKPIRNCLIKYSETGELEKIYLSDKNTNPATYWQEDFLELEEEKNNELNTLDSFNLLNMEVNRKLKDYESDKIYIKNQINSIFIEGEQFNLTDTLDVLYLRYKSDESILKKKKETNEKLTEEELKLEKK